MKTKQLMTVASAFFALALSSTAAVMNITVNSAGSYLQNGAPPGDPANSLASNLFYDSFQTPPSNNTQDSNFDFLAGVVNNWNTNFEPDLPDVINNGATADDDGTLEGVTSYTTAPGYGYVVFHFGNGQAGAGGGPNNPDENGWWAAWYLGGESATFSVPQEGSPLQSVGGFSSARYFNGTPTTRKVPDGGSTFLAFGIGLLGLGGVRRFLLKA